MNISTKDKGEQTTLLTVSLDVHDLSGYIQQAREHASRELEVDGFRKGKVPDDVAKQHLTDDRLREAALETALEESFTKVAREQQWDVAKTEELKVVKNTPKELSYTVLVRTWPMLDLSVLGQISVPRKSVVVTDEQFEEAMQTLTNMKATFMDKEGLVADGDRTEIDFSATMNGKQVPGAQGTNHPLVVGGKTFMPGFEEQLIGLRAGDTKEFDVTAPKDYPYPELSGQVLHFTATVNKVQIVMRPEVNEEFATSLKYDNVEALKGAVRESVKAQEQIKERDRTRLAIMSAIREVVKAPTPAFFVEEESENMLHRFETDLQAKGMGIDLYLARLNKTRDDLKLQWLPEAQRQVQMSLIVRQVIKDQKISVDEAEVESTMRDTLNRLSGQQGFSEDQVDVNALRRTVADRIVTEKALVYLERTFVTSEA